MRDTPLKYVREALQNALCEAFGCGNKLNVPVYFGVLPLKPRRLTLQDIKGDNPPIDYRRDPYIIFYGAGNEAVSAFKGLAVRTEAVRIDMRVAMSREGGGANGEGQPVRNNEPGPGPTPQENANATDDLEVLDQAVLKHLGRGGRLSSLLSVVDDVVDDDVVRLRIVRTVMIRR